MEQATQSILKELLDAAGISYQAIERTEIAGQTVFSVKADDARALIGAHGETIHALDILVKKILEKRLPAASGQDADAESGERGSRFLIDVDGYQVRRIQDLQTKALMMAERARSFQYDVELSPMSSYERLIVHTTLQGAPGVKTESHGEGRNRRVVIRYEAQSV